MNTACNKKACLISIVAVTLFLMGYGYVVHQIWLMPDYQATADMWRTPEEMKAFFPWCMLFPIAFAAIFTCLFKKFQKGYAVCCPESAGSCCPIKSGGMCFGLKLGLLLGLLMAQSYIWMPIPYELAVKWFFAGLGEGLGVGIILGMITRKMSGESCAKSACDTPENK